MNQQNKRPRLSTPKPDASFNPTADEFAAWCEHPTTRWVAAALESKVKGLTDNWSGYLFALDDKELISTRVEYSARIESLRTFTQATHADYLSELDHEAWRQQYGPYAPLKA